MNLAFSTIAPAPSAIPPKANNPAPTKVAVIAIPAGGAMIVAITATTTARIAPNTLKKLCFSFLCVEFFSC